MISPGVAGERFTPLLPVPNTLTGTRPEAGRKTGQFQHCGLQRCTALQSLRHQQPHHYQRIINTIVAANASLLVCLLNESNGKQLPEQGQDSRNRRFREVRRERECSSCLKSGYRRPETKSSLFVLTTSHPRHNDPKTIWH